MLGSPTMDHALRLDRRLFLSGGLAIGAAAALPGAAAAQEAKLVAEQKLMLVQASRILEHEGVLTGPGHVSVRHPTRRDRYLMSRTWSPRTVKVSDIREFDLDSNAIAPVPGERVFSERFIHGEFYKARPEVNAVVHSHAETVLPFTVVDQPIQVVVIDAARQGAKVPMWDIRDHFGDKTDVMVTDIPRAADLVRAAGKSDVILMRGHGFVAAAESLIHVTHLSIKLLLNAEIQQRAMAMGKLKPFSAGELEAQGEVLHDGRILRRFWDQWLERAPLDALQ